MPPVTEMTNAILRSFCMASALALAALPMPTAAETTSTAPTRQHQTYAILGPHFAHGKIDPALKRRIVGRARLALHHAPRPSARIRIEGTSSGQTQAPGAASMAPATQDEIAAAKNSLEDMEVMFDFALAWRLTGDKSYLHTADRYLDAWASTYRLSFNSIDEARFDKLILAYDLVKAATPSETRHKVNMFLRNMAIGYIEAMESGNVPIEPTLTNNWQSHRIKLATLAAFQIDDADLTERAHRLFNAQVDANLRPDGTTVDFLQRDALHYVTFSVSSQLMAAIAASTHGQNWYGYQGPDGQSLTKTLDWLSRFASGKQEHTEFVHSVVPYDRQRAAAGGAIFQNKAWAPETATQVYLMAGSLDPRWANLARRLERSKATRKLPLDSEEGPDEWLSIFMEENRR